MQQLEAGFTRLKLSFIPSHGNFISVRVGDAAKVDLALLKRGIIVRPIGNYGMPEYVRVTIGTAKENERFLEALAAVLRRMKPIAKLVVVGVGLIGGSAALALREAGMVGRVIGVGRSRENLDVALRLGIIDEATDDYALALDAADVVLITTPVAQMPAVLARIALHLRPETIVTDGGSTKHDVIAAARGALGDKFPQFVPAHPIAGTEHAGAAAALPGLFRGRRVILVPEPETDAAATASIAAMWEATGASISMMEAARHDRIFAAVSHLPHLLAFALVEELALRPDAPEYFKYAAGGFRDFTRIASSSPEMWRDIAVANREALLAELRGYRSQLERLERLLAAADASGLNAVFATARDARNAWLVGQS